MVSELASSNKQQKKNQTSHNLIRWSALVLAKKIASKQKTKSGKFFCYFRTKLAYVVSNFEGGLVIFSFQFFCFPVPILWDVCFSDTP